MHQKSRASLEFLLIVIFGTVCSVLVGAIGFGSEVLSWRRPEFQFLTFGFGCSVLAAVCRQRGLFTTLLFVLPIASVCSIPARRLFWYALINSTLFFGFAASMFESVWERLRGRLPFGKFVVLGILFAIFEVFKTPLLALAAGANNVLLQTEMNALLRGMLGLGVGLGIEVAEWIVAKKSQRV